MRFHAWVRPVSTALADCELSFVARDPVDHQRAARQHEVYIEALREAGCDVEALEPLDAHADSVFVEDTALVLDEVAIITRPGAPTRRGEVGSTRKALASHLPVLEMTEPATLDGGDVLRVGRTLYVGRSARSNAAGHEQLAALLAPFGYEVVGLDTRDCLHLKSAVTQIGDNVLLVQPAWLGEQSLALLADRHTLVEVDPSEEHAANTLRIGQTVIYPDCFPRTEAIIRERGVRLITLDVSELQKAEGAVTCCSLIRQLG